MAKYDLKIVLSILRSYFAILDQFSALKFKILTHVSTDDQLAGQSVVINCIARFKPNSITLVGSELVRSWIELKFGLSSSLLAEN